MFSEAKLFFSNRRQITIVKVIVCVKPVEHEVYVDGFEVDD